ncbi:MAG: hypothetical protein ACTH2G_00915, partial [Halomonadaceae bacterium]
RTPDDHDYCPEEEVIQRRCQRATVKQVVGPGFSKKYRAEFSSCRKSKATVALPSALRRLQVALSTSSLTVATS